MAASLAVGASSCIDETLPTDYVLSSQIEASDAAITGMVNAIYTTMAGYSNDDGGIETIGYGSMRVMLEHSTTPLACVGSNGWNTMLAWTRGEVAATGSNRGKYPSYVYYGYIKAVNDIIGMIPEDTDDTMRRHYLGICHAYRALFYHELVQIMEYKTPTPVAGVTYTQPENDLTNIGVPIVTEKTSSEQLSDNPRATVDKVYDLILEDLKKAEGYLDGYTRSDKVEADLSVVYGLYARVYLSLASRTATSATYKDANLYWTNAATYADKAKMAGNYSYLTEDQWTDPVNGFNNRNSQNSWMWATTISESNEVAATWGSFSFPMIMGTETDFIIYGYGVGRALDRKMYEQLSDNDFRKKSWLAPNFFYESIYQEEGETYRVDRDENGVLINNKWENPDGTYNDNYSGFGPDHYQYRLNAAPSWTRSRLNRASGFAATPWNYLNIKFRPHDGVYNNFDVGGCVDYPIMRVEEMDFIKAEAVYHTSGAGAAMNVLEAVVKTRNPNYPADGRVYTDFMDELNFQKQIEFWGEGINYFDAKRQELGVHRKYKGVSWTTRLSVIEVDGVFCGWTPGWNQAELNGNPAIFHYNNPYTNYRQFVDAIDYDEDIVAYFGCDLDDPDGTGNVQP